MSADVAGYSRLMGRDESGTLAALKAHLRELFEPKIAEYRSRIVKTTGGGLLVDFASVVDVMRCAVDVQRGMAERNAGSSKDKRIEFRIGINVGDIIIDGEDIYGDGVNVAARIQALAQPGGICINRDVRDQVRDKLSFMFDELGMRQVKNIARPIEVFSVRDTPAGATPDAGPCAEVTNAAPVRTPRTGLIAWSVACTVAALLIGASVSWHFEALLPWRIKLAAA